MGTGFTTKPALKQHLLQLVTEPTHHLGGVDTVIRGWGVVIEIQQAQETLLVVFLKDGQVLLHHCVIKIHEVHPIATVIKIIPGQGGYTENIFIAESHCWEGHVVSPHHVDLSDSRVGHQVQDSVPRPGDEETETKKEGQDPDDPLWFGLVWKEDKLQTMDLGPHYEIHSNLFPCRLK